MPVCVIRQSQGESHLLYIVRVSKELSVSEIKACFQRYENLLHFALNFSLFLLNLAEGRIQDLDCLLRLLFISVHGDGESNNVVL